MIVATADIHSPKYLALFSTALNTVSKSLNDCEAFLIAGDIVAKGNVYAASHVFNLIKKFFKGPIISIFGNEDYEEVEDKFHSLYPDIIWLNDNFFDLEMSIGRVRIIGTRGVLDVPTPWQAKNIPNITKIYEERLKRIEDLLRNSPYPTVLITHYAPTYKTLKGEPPRIWPQMGSKRLEEIVVKYKPLIVIHGHAHKGRIPYVNLNGVMVYNVSLPALRKLITIDLKKRDTLLSFM
ncbi:MAG: metallophosphoesterase [Thermoprotei archaeon]|nr:MAG: metallophosphoesterase [Thermoprotei archaeon]